MAWATLRSSSVPWAVCTAHDTAVVASSDGAVVHSVSNSHAPVLLRHAAPVTCAALSRDARTLVTASLDASVRIYRSGISTPVSIFRCSVKQAVSAHAALTADGRTLLLAFSTGPSSGVLEIRDWCTGDDVYGKENVVQPPRSSSVTRVDFSVGRCAIADDARTLCVEYCARNGETGVRVLCTMEEGFGVDGGNVGGIVTLRKWTDVNGYFASDMDAAGETVVIADAEALRVHTIQRGSAHTRDVHSAPIEMAGYGAPYAACCAISRDGKRVLAAVEEGAFRMWCAKTGAPVAAYAGHAATPTACAFGSAAIVTAAFDKTARVWGAPPNSPSKAVRWSRGEDEADIELKMKFREVARGHGAVSKNVAARLVRSAVANAGLTQYASRQDVAEIVVLALNGFGKVRGDVELIREDAFVKAAKQVLEFLTKCGRGRIVKGDAWG